jgi:Trypsin
MKLSSLGLVVFGAFTLAACSSGAGDNDASFAESREPIVGPSTLGGRNEVVMLYARFLTESGVVGTRFCSGGYFAPRVVATAAHCLENIFGGQLFIYYGDNFSVDIAQLVDGPNGLEAPPPGQPSFWAKADSFESHPSYDPAQHYPDIGFVYLDRKPPFDPLPLLRTTVAANRQVTVSGWGANSAPTPTTGAGGEVQRTGTSRTLGSPTAADFHPEDPNPGLLVAANRATLLKLDGAPPDANTCFGDSGSPLLITDSGQTYIAGVNYFTGLSCADYSLYTRISSFLPFFDEAYKKGGQEVFKPTFDCVAPNAQGTLTAFFGYDNKNGVSVDVPYGAKNSLANDTTNQRLKHFLPGTHHFSFGVDFASNQTLSWKLSPDNNPTTTVTVNQSSRRCGAAEADQSECALSCRASQRSGCAGLPTFEDCIGFCVDQAQSERSGAPQCSAANSAFNVCTAAVSPDPANWECFDTFGAFAIGPCAAQLDALNSCF